MSSVVVNRGSMFLRIPPDVTWTDTVALSCYVVAFEITPSTEDIDVGTFCAPSLTDQGRTTYSSVATLLWEPALYDAIQPHIGKLCTVQVKPVSSAGVAEPKGIEFNSRVPVQPWGRFEIGQRVEVELPLAVLTTPVWRDPMP